MENFHKRQNIINKIIGIVISILILYIVATMVLSFVLGPYIVFNSEDGRKIVSDVQEFYIFFIGFLVAFPFPINVQQQFISEWVIYLSIFAIFLFSGRKTFAKALKGGLLDDLKNFYDNNLSATISIFCIAVVLVFVIDILQRGAGISSGSLPETNPASLLTMITHAPIAEEIGFRLSIIGIFSLLIIRGWKRNIPIIEYLLTPVPTLRGRSDIQDKSDRATALFIPLILVSAFLFGLAHIAPGSTWEIGKLSQATVSGIMLGIAYAYYGLGAALLVHWSFNYYTNAIYMFEGLVLKIDTTVITSNDIAITYNDLILLTLGTILIIFYTSTTIMKKMKKTIQ